jgi:hypothetical protein
VVGAHTFSDPAWLPHEQFRLPEDGAAPLVWERPYGGGRVLLVAGPIGPALLYDEQFRPLARELLGSAAAGIPRPIRPLSPDTVALRFRGHRHDAVGVFAPPGTARHGQPLRLAVPAGGYTDLWTGTTVRAGAGGELQLPAPDGIAVLVTD